MPTPSRGTSAARAQSGFALIALLALAALIAAFLIASSLNRTAADVSNDREQRNMDALRKAKAALIAHAANEQWQLYKALPKTPASDASVYFQPGALASPDMDDDGDADPVWGPNTASQVGRVPYKTLGIDDLRDASGERLWYALSHDFRKLRCVPPAPTLGCTRINSDTMGQLTVNGTAPATQVVAIIFAPGAALDLRASGGPLQDRIAGHNDPANYLEGFNLDNPAHVNYVFASQGQSTSAFNDRLLVITQGELMAAVEPVVAARIQRDIAPLMQTYFTKWNAYPFAVPSAGGPPAAQSSYLGASTQTHGVLPLADAPVGFTWTGAAVTQLVGHPLETGSPIVTNTICTINTSPLRAVCQVDYDTDSNDRPVIALQVFFGGNVHVRFADTPSGTTNPDSLPMVRYDGTTPLTSGGSPYGQWSFVPPFFTPTKTFVARPNGGALTYIGRLQPAGGEPNHRVTITVPLPAPAVLKSLPIVNDSPGPPADMSSPPIINPTGAWFIANQWYKQTYYAVSPGFAPGGVAVGSDPTCAAFPSPPTTTCLKVNNLPTPADNKQAILVFAGRALNGTVRPSGTLANYLEGANLTAENNTTPYVYEHRAGAPTSINDRVVVVSP